MNKREQFFMARPGITYQEVSEIATQLLNKGQNPTIERVRLMLGTGSSTTIANHLRQWKSEQTEGAAITHKENIPRELNSIVKGLWEKIVSESEEKIKIIEQKYQTQINELQQELHKYKGNNQRWQHLYTQWIDEKKQLTLQKHAIEQKLHALEDEITLCKEKVEHSAQHIQEKQERIIELNRLHQQVQHNLELYRESTKEQNKIAQQQFDQQKKEWHSKLKNIEEQMNITKEKSFSLQQSLQLLQKTNTDLEKNYSQAQSALEQQRQTLLTCEKSKAEYAQSSAHWQQMYKNCQEMIESKTLQLINSHSETKSLAQQLKLANQTFNDVIKQNKGLEEKNWQLTKELEEMREEILKLDRDKAKPTRLRKAEG